MSDLERGMILQNILTARPQIEYAWFCALLAEERSELRQDGAGNNFGPLCRGVDSVLLNGAGNFDEVLVDHGNEGYAVFGSEVAEDLVEGVDVVRTIIGGQGDAREKNLDVSGFESGDNGVEILASLIWR
jgi:hypothetical protein